MGEYLLKWLDPAALSQLLGSLIGAGIAIILWIAEKRRQEREKNNVEAARYEVFRATLRSGVVRFGHELEYFLLQCRTTLGEIYAKRDLPPPSNTSYIKSVERLVEHFPLKLPKAFEFSELHLYALAIDSNEQLTMLKDVLQELYNARRGLKTALLTSEDEDKILDFLKELETNIERAKQQSDVLAESIKVKDKVSV